MEHLGVDRFFSVTSTQELQRRFGTSVGNHNQIWVNYEDLTTTSLEIMLNNGNYPQMAFILVNYSNLPRFVCCKPLRSWFQVFVKMMS